MISTLINDSTTLNRQFDKRYFQEETPLITSKNNTARHWHFAGFNIGAIFFGWLISNMIIFILTSTLLLSSVYFLLLNFGQIKNITPSVMGQVTFVGGIITLMIAGSGYFIGSYIAARLAKENGTHQGFGVWLSSLLINLMLLIVTIVISFNNNLINKEFHRLIFLTQNITYEVGALLIAFLAVSFIFSLIGGNTGEQYEKQTINAHYVLPHNFNMRTLY